MRQIKHVWHNRVNWMQRCGHTLCVSLIALSLMMSDRQKSNPLTLRSNSRSLGTFRCYKEIFCHGEMTKRFCGCNSANEQSPSLHVWKYMLRAVLCCSTKAKIIFFFLPIQCFVRTAVSVCLYKTAAAWSTRGWIHFVYSICNSLQPWVVVPQMSVTMHLITTGYIPLTYSILISCNFCF